MQRDHVEWDYYVFDGTELPNQMDDEFVPKLQEKLIEIGRNGWELVGVVDGIRFMFKRKWGRSK
jgi:hypothetical protein